MIVDDVPVYRDYLKNFIEWGSYGFEVCCEAKDGKEALAMYEQYQPDIVLTDIVMPYMDGLELSEKLLKDNKELSIILITGNSEFEYAKKAVKLGVCDYIVKPFEKEELIITLLKLQDNIRKVLEISNEQDAFKEEVREQQLRQYIYRKNDYAIELADEKVRFPYPFFLVVTVSIDLYENKIGTEDILNWKTILTSMLQDMIQINGKQEVFHDYEGNIVTILNFENQQSMEEYQGYEFEDLTKLAKEHIGIDISVGISGYCSSVSKLQKGYYQTLQALSSIYAPHTTHIFDYKTLLKECKREFYSSDLVNEINKAFDVLNYENIEMVIEQELNRIKEYENIENATMIYMSLLSILFSYLTKLGRSISDVFGEDFQPYSILNNEGNYTKKRLFLYDCYHKAIQYELEHQDTKTQQVARQAKEYIDVHFSNPNLSILDISKELLMNQTYLRKMFKAEYKMTITEYITKCRMERAKELILSENIKLSYVSYEVGYNDPSYFGKCFKKYYGYAPSDVINR